MFLTHDKCLSGVDHVAVAQSDKIMRKISRSYQSGWFPTSRCDAIFIGYVMDENMVILSCLARTLGTVFPTPDAETTMDKKRCSHKSSTALVDCCDKR